MIDEEEDEDVRLWLFIEDRLAEDEAARIEALSDEELGEELLATCLPTEQPGTVSNRRGNAD